MIKKKNPFISVRIKLFLTISLVILGIITFLILVNNFVFGQFYLYSKRQVLKSVYTTVNDYYNNCEEGDLSSELEQIAIKNNFDILIRNNQNINVFTSSKDFFSTLGQMNEMTSKLHTGSSEVIEKSNNYRIIKIKDTQNGVTYVLLSAKLDNNYLLYIRIPINSIQESVKISNNFLYLMAGFAILIAAVIVSYVSRKFTEPILELNAIAKKMSNLDFSHKYRITDADDEINNLGKSINTMSDKLEKTIKQLRNTNIELEKDIEEKSKIDEMRKSFISDVSHELKTPITSIIGYADTLQDGDYDKETTQKFLSVISSEGRRMASLVSDLLTLSRYDTNRIKREISEFDLGELAKKCEEKLQIEISKKRQNVECYVTADVPPISADKSGIERVILNVLSNAIKYTGEEGSIKIYVGFVYNDAYIKIIDNGIGIPKEDLNRIFERFYRVDKARSREMGGTGLGLSIAKEIIEQNKGSIDIKSEYGKGTEVVIRIPAVKK